MLKNFYLRINSFIKFYKCIKLCFNEKSRMQSKTRNFNINSNNPIFYPFSVKINRCSGNCNNINDPYARICVSDTAKNLNVKVFSLMSRTNETKSIK